MKRHFLLYEIMQRLKKNVMIKRTFDRLEKLSFSPGRKKKRSNDVFFVEKKAKQ
ncbi:hypothetical protein ABID27_000299 [Streptococcus gallinaceus]|uniref:Uncharacterized protein n=1 Tax=Streptococcus gallinaceus TaxID=165758 RepID=A0ABV2JIE6_9STRE